MAQSVLLPDGSSVTIRSGETPDSAYARAQQMYPEAFGGEKTPEDQPKSGFMPALKAGASSLAGSGAALAGRLGIMGLPEAEKYIAEQEAYQKKTFAPTTKSFIEAPLTNIAELAGGSIPYMVAPLVAGAAALPVAGVAGTVLGLGAAGLTSAAQFTGSNLSRQMDTGKKLGETDLGAAALAAIPQAALDTVSMRMIPGLGQIFERAGLNISAKAAQDLAKEGIKKTAADYLFATGKTMGREGLTEAGQQVFERMQAGLNLTDPAARAEYFDNFLGGAVLGGILAPAGRYVERGQEQGRFDQNQRDAQKQRSLEESQAKAEADAKLEAERQTPEYALNAQQVYQAAEQRQAELLAQLHKGSKENKLTEEQKQDNRATTLQLKEHAAVLSDAAKDYRSVKGVIAAETARKAQEAEQARIDAMSPEDFMLEQMKQGEGQGLQTSRRTKGRGQLYENEPLPPPAVDTSVQDYAATKMEEAYSNGLLPIRNASTNMLDNAGDFINFLADDFGMASRMVQEGKGVPGLSKKDNALLLSGLNLRLLQESKDSLAQKTADLSAQGTRAPKPTTGRGAFAEAYLSDADRLEQDRLAGEREDTIAKMQKYAAMPRDVVEQGELFGTERSGVLAGQRPDTEAQLAELESQLQAAYVARNTAPGMRNRTSERISTLVEQIKDLRERAAKSTEQGRTDFGTETQSLQEQLGSLPEQLQKQRDAAAARTTAFGKLADVKNTEQADVARQEVLESLIAEIELGRGAKLKPETITQIEKDAGGILDAALRDNKDANPDLDSLSARWRSGTRATFDSASVTKTPLGASPEMLIEQLQKAFVNRDRQGNLTKYDDKTQTLLQQLVDNFGSFSANPDRRNLASDWLHRVTVTGRPAPELETEIRDELATLEKAKISETQTIERETAFGTARRPETAVQLELPERFMPKEVEGKAPEKAATSFSSAGEFQKYLASDALKSVRESLGLTKQTSARMHERLGVFRKKVDRLTGQLTALQSRKMELQRLKGAEANTARAIINDAEARLKTVADQLDLELRDLQVDYLKASEKFDFSAQTVSDIGQRIAENIGKFEAVDDPVVEAAKVTAQYKADFAEAMQQPVNKKNYSAIRKARQYIIDAINAQRKLANKAPARFVAFLDADLNLQMQLQEEERIMDAAAKELLSAGLALEETAKKQNRSRKNKKALDTAQKELADALGLQKSAIADVDAQLEKVATDIEATKKGIVGTRRTLTSLETPPKSEFDTQLAATTQARPSSEERAAKAESDRAKLQAFQDTAARLSTIPGQRIDFTKRREWLDLVAASTENFDSIAQDIKDATNGIEELQIRSAIAEEKQLTSTDPVEKEKLQKTIDTNTERIAELEKAKKQYENSHKKMVISVDRATKAASSDPEVAAAFTAVIDKRLDKLVKTINKKVADIAQKIDPKTNIKVPAKTMAQRRKDLAMFKKELVVLSAQRSNRLGIARIDAVTDKQVAPKKTAKGTAEEQQSVDEALQRMQEYGAEKERLKALQEQRKKLVATKVPKVKAKQAERVEKIRALQETIIAQKALVGKLAPKKVGAISAAARKQSSAPKKLLTGTKESKEEVGVVKQPIVEERNVVQPTAKKAIADANAIAKEKLAAAKPLTQAEIADLSLAQHDALVDAVQKMVADTERELADLQEKTNYSNKTKLVAYTSTDYKNKLKAAKVTKEAVLGTAKANLKALLEEETALPEDVSPIDLGEEGALYRTKTSEGAGMKEQEVARLADRITANWTTIPEIVVVATEKGLPLHIQEQAKRDNMTGKIPGLYDTETKKVYLVAENLHTGEDVALTVAHEIAGHFGLREMLGGEYAIEMNRIYSGNAAVSKAADAKMAANARLSKETAVEEVLADIAETGPTAEQESALRRIYNIFKRMFARVTGAKYLSDEEVRQVVVNARHYVQTGEGGRGGEVAVEKAVFRAADYKSDDALSKAAQRVVAQPKTLLQKVRGNSNVLLEAQMQGADMRAGLIKALENAVEDPRTMGSTKLFRQAIFSITAADQHMPITQMAATMGPPKMFKDEKGYYEVRSSMENSAIDVFDSVQDIPDRYGNAEAKMGMASMYMIAQRALNKGLAKLDTGAMGVTEQELQDVMRSVDADPELKAALEKTRKLYNAYNKGMIEWLASPQVAAISRDDAKAFLKDEDYVPYYRVLPNGNAELVFGGEKTITIGDIKHQPYLAELKGGDAKIMPLNQSVMRNTMLLVTKGMTNMAQKNIAYAMQAAGAGQGKDKSNLMPVHKGQGVADASIIRWTQEPDPSDPKDKGERWLRIQTNDTMFGGIPAELIIKSMEGAHLTLPAFLKLGGMAGDLLRAGVTRTPIYLARQLIRDPFAATATTGLDYGPLTAIFRANKEFLKMTRGQSETGAKLIEKGLVQSGIFDGSPADMEKMALQLAGGESLSLLRKLFKGADSLAIKADAATRALIYDNAIKNGLSEVEASHAVRESMNFYKRGLSPTVQYASRMIPFFNAQIQGLSVLAKAARGNMPFDEQLNIKRKFINNAMMLTGVGIAYAMAMDDDEYYKNAKPKDRYSNFFLHLPGVDEPVKLPIPYEFGWFFSAGVAAADAIKGEVNTPQQLRALKDMFVGAIPGASNLGMPQIIKPIAEVYANKSFFSGNPLESERLRKLDPEARYNASTTEMAKWFASMVPGLSPIQIEHIVSGYLGQVPLMVAASADGLFAKDSSIEEPTRRISQLPLIGSSFQRKYGGEEADVVYKLAADALETKRTFDNYRSTGKIELAKEYLQDHRAEIMVAPMALQYQKVMGQIRKQEEIVRGSRLDADAKAKRIEELDKQRQLQSERYMKAIQRAEAT